ncbi:MAG TPA: enoyl-CoA hydratase-related protein [Candidatus Binatia bacterium]|nr:enoyl-CoA hydratase-related protein [Candidatus Binatia bacterium]
MPYKCLTVSIEDGVATITLDRPEAANAINLDLARDLTDVAIACEHDPSVRAVLMTGAGPMFCAGGDVKTFASAGDMPALLKEITTYLHAGISRLARMNAPVVMAVNGTAAGGGMSLACAGDFVLAADTARFTMAYTRIGLAPDGSSSYFLPRRIGIARTRELMILSPVLSAAQALEWGLIDRVIPAAELMTSARALALELASGPTRAYGEVKRLLLDTFGNGLETQMELESRAIAAMGATADGAEGVRAFVAKTKARFTGA